MFDRIGCKLAAKYELAKGQNLDLALTSHRTCLSRCFKSVFQCALLIKWQGKKTRNICCSTCSNLAGLFWDWVTRMWKPTCSIIVKELSEPHARQGWPGPRLDVLGHSKSVASMLISRISADGSKSYWAHCE